MSLDKLVDSFTKMGHKFTWNKMIIILGDKTRAKQHPVPGISRGTGPTKGTESKGDSLDWHTRYSLLGPAVPAFTSGN